MKKSSNETKLIVAVPLDKSGVPTCPLDGVTVIVVKYKYF
jgi:hypothetical protein